MNYSHFVGLDVGKKTFDASLMSAAEKELSVQLLKKGFQQLSSKQRNAIYFRFVQEFGYDAYFLTH